MDKHAIESIQNWIIHVARGGGRLAVLPDEWICWTPFPGAGGELA
ncbi:hypothetical protein ACQF1Z_004452 [Escherichia coli]